MGGAEIFANLEIARKCDVSNFCGEERERLIVYEKCSLAKSWCKIGRGSLCSVAPSPVYVVY